MNKESRPLVSIVIPSYNHGNFIQNCIQSIINQTYQQIELIIIDDGSTDDSVLKIQELLDTCKKRFVRFEFRHRLNKGLSATLNEALDWCQGEYYSAIASDDVMLERKTATQVELLQKNLDVVAVFGAIELIDNTKKIGEIRQPDKFFEFKDLIYTEQFLPAPTQMIRLVKLRETGGYVDNMIIDDWYIYLKLLENDNRILYVNEIFCKYRVHTGNSFSNPVKMALGRLQVINEFKEHELFKKTYIKVCWENAFETLKMDFRLSILVFFTIFFKKVKIVLKKIFGKI
ncbi:glycosyltransferase [Acinetobacter bereziniae]|uniref:glycosyltransferase n=2 Tax=Acinetobacter bereziniae TaxID=106648 RepID=UPI0005A89597|nr:glycosyltransferase [Acinetobacter bereziniae]